MPLDPYQAVKDVAEAAVRQRLHEGALRAIDLGKGGRIANAGLEAPLDDATCGRSNG